MSYFREGLSLVKSNQYVLSVSKVPSWMLGIGMKNINNLKQIIREKQDRGGGSDEMGPAMRLKRLLVKALHFTEVDHKFVRTLWYPGHPSPQCLRDKNKNTAH